PEKVEVGEKATMVISIRNPYKHRELSTSEFNIEGNGLDVHSPITGQNVAGPGEQLYAEVPFLPKVAGDTALIVHFSSDELQNVTAVKKVAVGGTAPAWMSSF
uniref:Transglut_C domain-containing protein n=1 Tax=Steinernema glaseri TaxID=37863 RepID=A0A1I8AAH6_9BILA